MDLEKNNQAQRKERVQRLLKLKSGAKVHVAGVCGTGTSAVALLLKKRGFFVSGSDKAFYPPMDIIVKSNCDKLFTQFSADNITKELDFVVIGNALGASNPEVQRTMELGIDYCSMPDVFEALLIGSREHCPNSVVMAGTHGKTTTTALTSWIFESAGREPGYFLGGIPENFESHIRPVSENIELDKRVVILEGDEYDSAFFAKWPKFHSYRPDILVVTSLEFDHADIYRSVDEIREQFFELIKAMPASGKVLFWSGSEQLRLLAKELEGGQKLPRIYWYGEDKAGDFKLLSRTALHGSAAQVVEVEILGQRFSFTLTLSGEHNALNGLVAASVAMLLGVSSEDVSRATAGFLGVKRRQQPLHQSESLLILEDFAHHPTAVKTTLSGIKEQYSTRRLVAVFEPRSNTSRRNFFQDSYGKSFSAADVVLIQDIADQNIYTAFGEPGELLKVDLIIDQIAKEGKQAFLCKDSEEIFNKLTELISEGDVVILMSNGAFGGLPAKLKSYFQKN